MQKELLEINNKDKDYPYVRDVLRNKMLLSIIFNISIKEFELFIFEVLNNPKHKWNSPSFREWVLKWKN